MICSFIICFNSLKGQEIIEKGSIILSDPFNELSPEWQSFYLDGSEGGSYAIDQRSLRISSKDSKYGLFNSTPVSGHFYAEVNISADDHAGLALFHRNPDGTIGLNNCTSICVDSVDGEVNVYVSDRQNGSGNLLDNTYQVSAANYRHVLNGQQYSIKFSNTNYKLRIFHDNLSGFFHFLYAVKKEIKGVEKEDWIELFPSSGWFICLFKYW